MRGYVIGCVSERACVYAGVCGCELRVCEQRVCVKGSMSERTREREQRIE